MSEKTIISTKEAPAAIGPYSQAVRVGPLLFVSGQIPVNPATGDIPGNVQDQTHQSMKNLQAIIQEAGGTLKNVVKTTVFIKNMDQFAEVNEVYGQYFQEDPPARACVEAARLPKDVLVEVEAVVYLP
ncbi:MAG: RidA family protein [Desulfotomaculum sp.]|nr:RidA family protein [Desulfotomaculum sp.]